MISEASRLLLEGAKAGNSRLAGVAKEIIALEHQGDEIIHEIFTRLNQTSSRPSIPRTFTIFPRNSTTCSTASRIPFTAWWPTAWTDSERMIRCAEIIHRCCLALEKAFHALEKNEKVMEHCIEINRLENEADNLVAAPWPICSKTRRTPSS